MNDNTQLASMSSSKNVNQWILLQQVIMEVAVVTTTSPKSCKNSVYHHYKHDQHSALKSFYSPSYPQQTAIEDLGQWLQLRFVCCSIAIRLWFNFYSTLIQPRTFILCCTSWKHAYPCTCAAGLWRKYVSVIVASWLHHYALNDLW